MIDERLKSLFEASDPEKSVAVRVNLDGGFKAYISFGEKEHEIIQLHLQNEKEEEVFKMFRYPDLYCSEVKDYVIRMLSTNEEFKNRYTTNAFEVRKELREKFKDVLMLGARKILNEESESKKVYESKTIIANASAIASVLTAEIAGIDIPDTYIVILLAILNIILRLLTRKPIRV